MAKNFQVSNSLNIQGLMITNGTKHPDYPKIYDISEKLDRLNDSISEKISSYVN